MHNKTQPPRDVHYTFKDGPSVEIPPGKSVIGPWEIIFDPEEYPNLSSVADESDITFHGADDSFDFNSVTFRS